MTFLEGWFSIKIFAEAVYRGLSWRLKSPSQYWRQGGRPALFPVRNCANHIAEAASIPCNRGSIVAICFCYRLYHWPGRCGSSLHGPQLQKRTARGHDIPVPPPPVRQGRRPSTQRTNAKSCRFIYHRDCGLGSPYTLNRNSMISPSLTRYSLPSDRHLPASFAPASPLYWT